MMNRLVARTSTALPLVAACLLVSAFGPRPAASLQSGGAMPADTIYALAVDSAYKLDRPTLYLLDEGIVRMEADGRATRTYRQVIQVLKQESVRGLSERSIRWMPDRQTITVNWVKVVKPNGEVVSAEPAQSQDSDVPAAISNPVYGNQRVRRMSLSGVAVGTLLDVSYTIADTAAYPPMDQFESWWFTSSTEVKRSHLAISVPESVNLTVVEQNLNFRRTESRADGRRVHRWITKDVPYIPFEMFVADSNAVDMMVRASLPRPWKDVGLWYDGLAKDRYSLGAEAQARVRTVTASARTREDSIRALHGLVAQDVRYVSVSLGIGGYQPRHPDTVAVTGFGDCKDKATFFVSVLRSWGIPAHPVLLSAYGRTDPLVPSARQFNHAIAAVETRDGYQFVDLTASSVPYGELPGSVQGQFAIVIRADGRVDEVRIPEDPATENSSTIRITGALTPDGIFNGRYEETATGTLAASLRAAFENPPDSTRRANLVRSIANRVYQGSTGDSLEVFNGKDFTAKPHVSLVVRGGKAATKTGSTMVVNLNLGSFSGMSATIDRLESQIPRKYTIDAAGVLGTATRMTEFRLTLPEGWKAQLPDGINAKSAFGEVRTEYLQEGRDLIIRRMTSGSRGVHPPERVTDLIDWMKVVAQDDVRFVMLAPTTQTP